MIEEKKYTVKIPVEFKEKEKIKYTVTGNNDIIFDTYQEAERYEKYLDAEVKLQKWPQYEIGENIYYFILDEEKFNFFSKLWKTTDCYFGFSHNNIPSYTDWCPPQKPNYYPTLLYHFYWGNPNGRDDNEFRFVNPCDLQQWLADNTGNN